MSAVTAAQGIVDVSLSIDYDEQSVVKTIVCINEARLVLKCSAMVVALLSALGAPKVSWNESSFDRP